jgi:hypothetical protein
MQGTPRRGRLQMRPGLAALWIGALTALGACGDSPYQPDPAALVGEFSGRAGSDFATYDLFLAVDQVSDSVRGVWSLSYLTSCSTHDGPFSGTLSGERLLLRLRPDSPDEATFDVSLRVLRGDSGLSGQIVSVVPGASPLCFSDYAPITLHYGDVNGLPIGR